MARCYMHFTVPGVKVKECPIGFDADDMDEFNLMAGVVWRTIVQTWSTAKYQKTIMEVLVPWSPPQ